MIPTKVFISRHEYKKQFFRKEENCVEPYDTLTHCILDYCNSLRKRLGRKPVKRLRKGVRQNSCDCVISNTVGEDSCRTSSQCFTYYTRRRKSKVIWHPSWVEDWLHRFDQLDDYDNLKLPTGTFDYYGDDTVIPISAPHTPIMK